MGHWSLCWGLVIRKEKRREELKPAQMESKRRGESRDRNREAFLHSCAELATEHGRFNIKVDALVRLMGLGVCPETLLIVHGNLFCQKQYPSKPCRPKRLCYAPRNPVLLPCLTSACLTSAWEPNSRSWTIACCGARFRQYLDGVS